MRATIVVLCCLLVSVPVLASWGDIPSTSKTELVTRSYGGDVQLTIRILYATGEAMTALYESPDGSAMSQDDLDAILGELEDRWPGQQTILVGVIPSGTQYFWPWDLAFTQGNSQYDVDYNNFTNWTESFDAGQLREGVVALGFVAVPKGIDLTQSFRIWYDDEYTVMPPLERSQE